MRNTLILCVIGILMPSARAQKPNLPTIEHPTHMLQLIPTQTDKPIDMKVELCKKDKRKLLVNIMPDGQRMKSEYIVTKNNAIKFQWVAIKRDGLLAIQFIGKRVTAEDSFQGKYVALVDGELRKDMSGLFKLTAIEAGR